MKTVSVNINPLRSSYMKWHHDVACRVALAVLMAMALPLDSMAARLCDDEAPIDSTVMLAMQTRQDTPQQLALTRQDTPQQLALTRQDTPQPLGQTRQDTPLQVAQTRQDTPRQSSEVKPKPQKRTKTPPPMLITAAPAAPLSVAEQATINLGDTALANPLAKHYTAPHPLVYEDYSDLPPYSFYDEQENPTGFNVELVRFLLDKLAIPYTIHLKNINEAYRDMGRGEADLILSIYANKRKPYGIYGAVPVNVFNTSLLTPKSKPLPDVKRVRELGHHKVVVHTGSQAYDVMKERGMGDNTIVKSHMVAEMLSISERDSGMVVWNTMSMKYILRRYRLNNLQLQPIYDLHTDTRFFSRDTVLLALLDSVYLAHQSDPEVVALRQKWFYPETYTEVHESVWYSLGILAALCLLGSLLYYHYRRLDRQALHSNQEQNQRLSLYLRTGGITMWLYRVHAKQFVVLDDHGEERRRLDSTAFATDYDSTDFASIVLAIEQVSAGEKDNVHISVRCHAGKDDWQYHDLLISVLERDRHGRAKTLLGTQSDVTRERKQQIMRQETALKFRTAFNISTAWLLCFDKEGSLTAMNQAALNALGCNDVQDLIDQNFSIDDVPLSLDDTDYATGGEAWVSARVDFDRLRREGRLHPAVKACGSTYHEVVVSRVHDHHGELLATYVAGLDITEGVMTARESRQREREIENLFKQAREGMSLLSHSLALAHISMAHYSPKTHAMTFAFNEGGRAAVSMTQVQIMEKVAEEDRHRVARLLMRLDKCSVRTCDMKCHTRIPDPNGGFKIYLISILPVTDDKDCVDHYIVLTRDITSLEVTRHQLERETERAQEAERIKNAFLRNMSAEIRIPLNHILSQAERLGGTGIESDEDYVTIANDMHSTCGSLLTLVGDILTLSKIEAGMVETHNEEVDFAVYFPAICQMAIGDPKPAGLDLRIDTPYSALTINTDTSQVSKIIEGLYHCSILLTKEGFIRSSYEYFNDTLVIRIEDSGAGLTPKQIRAITEHSFSSQDARMDMCIKLAIVRERAKMLGGRMDVESTPGHGTTIWISLPCSARDISLTNTTDNVHELV